MTIKPFRIALLIGGGYTLLCAVYIWVSGSLALRLSQSLPGLQRIELYKGLAFVVITGIILFGLIFTLMRRIRAQHGELEVQRKALVESQSRALTGTFASGIAHDINNVLSIVDFSLVELQETVPEAMKTHIERIDKAFTMVQDLSTRLQRIGKARTEAGMQRIEIGRFLHETIDFAQRHKKLKRCAIAFHKDEEAFLKVNPFLIEQMLINLMLNAADATNLEGRIEVRLKSAAEQIHIEVHDNGPGIPENQRHKMFQPYHTTKSDGTGLGLANVKAGAQVHGGSVQVERSDLGGALFRIVLPIAPSVPH